MTAGARSRRPPPPSGPGAPNAALARLLLDPSARSDPYPIYAALRDGPPACVEHPFRCVALATYRDVTAALRNHGVFSSAVMRAADPTLLGADPPAHTRTKRLVARAFTPARVASLQATIRNASTEAVERMARARTADVIAELAHPLPLIVLRAMLGLGCDDEERLTEGVAAVMAEGGERGSAPDGALARRLADLDLYLTRLVDTRRRHPGPDVISAMLLRDAAGDALSPDETRHFVRLLLAAAVETTSNLIGNTLLVLLRFPSELERVRGDPTLVRAAVAETLRFDSPVQMVRRSATAPVTIGGTRIEGGSHVLLLLGSANRDPARFAHPDRFDLARAKREHVAFGSGAHACIGALLASAQAAGALEALVTGFRTIRPHESLADLPRPPGLHVRGVTRLVVEVGR